MHPWKLLDSAQVPGGDGELRLYQRDAEFSMRVAGQELMNSRVYASEDVLSELGCGRIKQRKRARVLIGGLGMGYSLKSALGELGEDATVVVAELVPAVVSWNRGPLGHLARHPLRDPRVVVREADVGAVIREGRAVYDAILLDVDNGPDGLTRKSNDALYGAAGLRAARSALRPRGLLGVWSAARDRNFHLRLQRSGFDVEEIPVRARSTGKGSRHTIWLASLTGARAKPITAKGLKT
jgi:spermidine synthase